ncbi:hypothetical protein [Pontibacter ruber]|uniref:GRAM domain-containing protein n=1 Tax=Pontibacter ruber TaxID=1343895 RepID=A0ABW5CZI1_9BACT|nr:hypothetical protein [Pontibacter ruber]
MKISNLLLAAFLLLVNTAFCRPVTWDERKSDSLPENIQLSRYGALIGKSELLPNGGIISVTSTKLIFTPIKTFLSKDVSIQEIPLDEIAKVTRTNTLGIMPNGILLLLQDGTSQKLQTIVFRRKKLYELLLSQTK